MPHHAAASTPSTNGAAATLTTCPKLIANLHEDLAQPVLTDAVDHAPHAVAPVVSFFQHRVAARQQFRAKLGVARELVAHADFHDIELHPLPVRPLRRKRPS